MASPRGRRGRRQVSVTDLTSILYCEREVVLKQRHGRIAGNKANRRSSARGQREHDRHHRNARRFHRKPATAGRPAGDPRCFIASALYGPEAWKTHVLRTYRDRVLTATMTGRLLVRVYYQLSPPVAGLLLRAPRLRRWVVWAVSLIVHRAEVTLSSRHVPHG